MRTVRILLLDDHAVVRAGVRAVLEADGSRFEIVAEAGSADEALALCERHRPDVAVVDLRLGGTDGVDAARAILQRTPSTRVLILTSYDGDESIYRALDAGARGYVLKDAPVGELVAAVRAVADGGRHVPADVALRMVGNGPRLRLTLREREVLAAMAEGLRTQQIATRTRTAQTTVRTHIQNLLEKFGCSDRGAVVLAATNRGFLMR